MTQYLEREQKHMVTLHTVYTAWVVLQYERGTELSLYQDTVYVSNDPLNVMLCHYRLAALC